MAEFIDRAKLEAEAEKRWPLWLPTGDYEADREGYDEESAKWQNAEAEEQRQSFLAGVAAYAALLDAETTEEWGVQDTGGGFLVEYDEEADARDIAMNSERPGATISREVVSRRVLYGPWLPSEGGESVASRLPQDDDDSTIHGLMRAEEVLRGIEHHWPADSVAQAITELRSLRELCTEAETDDDAEGGESSGK